MALKKCKGTGKAKGLGCGSELTYTETNGIKSYFAKYGLGISCCYPKFLYESEEGQKILDKSISISKKKVEKEQRRERNKKKKEERQKIKTLADWKNDLQKEVNWIAKKLDEDLPCISHPNTNNFLRWDAGHGYSVKAHSDLRFNLHNIHKQNSQSNQIFGGDSNYTRGLKERYGMDYLEMYLNLPLKWKGIGKEKYKIPNIRDVFLPNARRVVIEMKAGAKFTRDQVNEMIGIYV